MTIDDKYEDWNDSIVLGEVPDMDEMGANDNEGSNRDN
jgi:hypothetical protein